MLFTIDDRTYRAALEQAQAALAEPKRRPALAQSEANRTDKLVHTNLVSREEWGAAPVSRGSGAGRHSRRAGGGGCRAA